MGNQFLKKHLAESSPQDICIPANKANQGSQLLGVGLNLLGTLGGSFIESGGLQPKTSTPPTPTQFADMSDIAIDTSGLGQNLTLTTPSSGLSLNQ